MSQVEQSEDPITRMDRFMRYSQKLWIAKI